MDRQDCFNVGSMVVMMNEDCCDILAISTHPDDIELACGGSLILAARQGLRVVIQDLTRGEASSRGTVIVRHAEATEAARRLGVLRRQPLDLPDTQLGKDIAEADALVAVIRALRPRLVLGPAGSDRHPDHVAACALVRRALFLAGLATHGTGERHRVATFASYPGHHPITPSFVVDVTSVWQERMDALAAYASQFQQQDGAETILNGGDFLRFVEARAIMYGAMIGSRYGEAYQLDGPMGVSGLGHLWVAQTSSYKSFL